MGHKSVTSLKKQIAISAVIAILFSGALFAWGYLVFIVNNKLWPPLPTSAARAYHYDVTVQTTSGAHRPSITHFSGDTDLGLPLGLGKTAPRLVETSCTSGYPPNHETDYTGTTLMVTPTKVSSEGHVLTHIDFTEKTFKKSLSFNTHTSCGKLTLPEYQTLHLRISVSLPRGKAITLPVTKGVSLTLKTDKTSA